MTRLNLSLADVSVKGGEQRQYKNVPLQDSRGRGMLTKIHFQTIYAIETDINTFKMPSELEDLVGFINHGSTPVRQLGVPNLLTFG